MRILLASTAMVLAAGAASAQVTFSGYGRFGIGYQEDRSSEETALISRFRLNIDGNAVTDGGVKFQARVRLQADDSPDVNEQNSATLNGARYTVEYGGFQVNAGNVSGALDNSDPYFGFEPGLEEFTGQYAGVDYDFLEYDSTGAGSNAVSVVYQQDQFLVMGSYDPDSQNNNDRWDIGVQYTFAGNYTAYVGYAENEDDQNLLVGVLGAEYDQFAFNLFLGNEDLNLAATDPDTDGMVYGVSGAINVGAATQILVSYGSGEGDADTESYAAGFIHDLGGGVSLRGGIGSEGPKDGDSHVIADLGVLFNF